MHETAAVVRGANADDGSGKGTYQAGSAEEPEIVRLLAFHYRAMLQLGWLTSPQQRQLRQLIAKCEVMFADDSGHPRAVYDGDGADVVSELPWQPVASIVDATTGQRQHQNIDCLTAIRCYAAGARKALANGKIGLVASALAKIEAQVTRNRELLSATQRTSDEAHPQA